MLSFTTFRHAGCRIRPEKDLLPLGRKWSFGRFFKAFSHNKISEIPGFAQGVFFILGLTKRLFGKYVF